MKFFIASFVLAVLGSASAAPSGLHARDVDIVVTYNGIPGPIDYSFGDCIPFTLDGAKIVTADFNEPSKCTVFSDGACQHAVNPVPLIIPPGYQIPNGADFGELIGESAMCYDLN